MDNFFATVLDTLVRSGPVASVLGAWIYLLYKERAEMRAEIKDLRAENKETVSDLFEVASKASAAVTANTTAIEQLTEATEIRKLLKGTP